MSERDKRILALIASGVAISREIGAGVGATRAQIHQALLVLESRGHIRRGVRAASRKGPPSILWRIAA